MVRAAVLARADADAQRSVQDADDEVADRITEAADRVAKSLEVAAATTRRDAEVIVGEARARARRQARAIVLAAQRSAVEELRSQSRAAVRGLREDPGYPAAVARLTAVARQRLGPAADVREQPEGGIIAEAGGRRLSLTLDAAADRALAALGSRVEELWRP